MRSTFDIAALRQPAVGADDGDLGNSHPAQVPLETGSMMNLMNHGILMDFVGAHFSDKPRDSMRFSNLP